MKMTSKEVYDRVDRTQIIPSSKILTKRKKEGSSRFKEAWVEGFCARSFIFCFFTITRRRCGCFWCMCVCVFFPFILFILFSSLSFALLWSGYALCSQICFMLSVSAGLSDCVMFLNVVMYSLWTT